jgi:Kelch motif.
VNNKIKSNQWRCQNSLLPKAAMKLNERREIRFRYAMCHALNTNVWDLKYSGDVKFTYQPTIDVSGDVKIPYWQKQRWNWMNAVKFVLGMQCVMHYTQMCEMKALLFTYSFCFLHRYDGASDLASAECYNPMTNKWTPVTPMGTKRSCLGKYSLPFSSILQTTSVFLDGQISFIAKAVN